MRNLLLGLFVLALLVGYQFVTSDPAAAQGKKGAETGVIEIKEGKDGKYRFNVRDNKGKLLAQSPPAVGHATVKDAEAAIDRLKSVLGTAKVMVMDKKAKAE